MQRRWWFCGQKGRYILALAFGEEYTYAGSDVETKSKEIPDVIQKVIDKQNTDFKLEDAHAPNSALVNYYPVKNQAIKTNKVDIAFRRWALSRSILFNIYLFFGSIVNNFIQGKAQR